MEEMKRGRAVLAIVAVLVAGGCSSVPVVSDSNVWGHASLDEQRAWVEAQADEAIEVLGRAEGWFEFSPEYPWPEEREMLMETLLTENCRPNQGSRQPGRLSLILNNGDFEDPFEAAERLKRHWIEQGWTVGYVIDPAESAMPREYFRADREDGAGLGLSATANNVSLMISSACSDHGTVVYRHYSNAEQ